MENILENNKLIAEFMNLSIKEGVSYYTDENDMYPRGIEVEGPYIPYDSEWNWLMEVVEELENSGVEITIGRMYCEIKYKDLFDKSKTFEIRIASGVKINAVNGAVVEFLKWYNENK